MRIIDYFTYKDVNDKIAFKKGVMKRIQETQNQPFEWLTEEIANLLDENFVLEHSGDKRISPVFRRLIYLSDKMSQPFEPLEKLAKDVMTLYSDKWNKIYSALVSSDYNPLDNYNMEQVETPDITKERNIKTNTKLVTSSEGDSNNDTYGFNSALPVPSDKAHAESETTVEGSDVDNNSNDVETETGTRELTRRGNIGVTTSQQMLESEIELREHYNFYEIVLNDIAKLLCLNVY